MAKKCSICGKKFGFFDSKISLADGLMCTQCWQYGGLGHGSQAMFAAMDKTVAEMKSIRAMIEKNPSAKTSVEVSAEAYGDMYGISWEEYYHNFLKWSTQKQKEKLAYLEYFGNTDEVFDICIYLSSNQKLLNIFVEKAFQAGVRFRPKHVIALLPLIKQPLRNQIAEFASDKYTKVQLEKLHGQIEDGVFYRILSNHGVKFAETPAPLYDTCEEEAEPGFWESFFSPAEGSEELLKKKKHDGHCDGDCANCPPHYGYRYGRWYYGHGHIEGCEFGGNRGGCTWEIQKKKLEDEAKRESLRRRR